MAFVGKYVDENGMEAPYAYYKVAWLEGSKERMEIYIDVYYNEEAYTTDKPRLRRLPFNFSPKVGEGEKDFYCQAYEFLKDHEFFKGFIFKSELSYS